VKSEACPPATVEEDVIVVTAATFGRGADLAGRAGDDGESALPQPAELPVDQWT